MGWLDSLWGMNDAGREHPLEWTLDAIGWLGGFLADLAARESAGVPLLLTVSRVA